MLYHGIRLKERSEKIALWNQEKAKAEVQRALKHFKIKGRKELLPTFDRYRIKGFWCTTDLAHAKNWAKWNPEIVSLTLSLHEVPESEVLDYLKKTYGGPHVLRINFTADSRPGGDSNIFIEADFLNLKQVESLELVK